MTGGKGFTRQQQSEDTERVLRGRPQKYGAAQDDDSQGAAESGMMPSVVAPDDEQNEQQQMQQLQADNAQCQARLDVIEQKLGISQQQSPEQQPPMDDQGFGEER